MESYIDDIINEVGSMTPDYGFNVCLFDEYGETKLELLGHFDTFGEAQEFADQFDETVYIYGNEDAKESSSKKNHNIDKYLDMAEKDYLEGSSNPNEEYEKTNYGEESVDDLQRRKKQLEDELQYTDAYNTSQRIKSELDIINYQLEKQGQFTGVRYSIRGSDDRVIVKSNDLNEAKMIAKNHSHHGAYIVDEKTKERIQVWEAMANEDIYDSVYDSMTEDQKRMYNTLPYEEEDSNEINKTEYLQLVSVMNGESYESKCKTCGKLLDYEGYNYCEDDCPHTQDTEETDGGYVSCTGCGKSLDNEAFTKYSLLTDLSGQDLNTMNQQNNDGMDDSDESYESVYNFAEEQIGQGTPGHRPWMRQFKLGGEQNKMCIICNAYTDQSEGKCIICGNSELSIEVRKSYNTKAFEANINKYDPNDPDYQYMLDYPNDGAIDKEDQAVPRETMNEVMSMPQTGKTCYTCGYYDEDGVGNHTCS